MTTGPEPMIRTDAGFVVTWGPSSRGRGLERGNEPVEHRDRVEWTRCAFGVVLDRLDRELDVPQALDRAIVEIDLAHPEAAVARQRLAHDLDLVVLRGHLDVASVEVADGVIRAVVAEPQPARLGARGSPHDLMPEADPEQRSPGLDHGPRQRDRPGESGRVARPG